MKYKILVVDDDKELVKMLCSYFHRNNMKPLRLQMEWKH